MADYKEGIVESIKIATLEKQIEILEKLGLSKDEILERLELNKESFISVLNGIALEIEGILKNSTNDIKNNTTKEHNDTRKTVEEHMPKVIKTDSLTPGSNGDVTIKGHGKIRIATVKSCTLYVDNIRVGRPSNSSDLYNIEFYNHIRVEGDANTNGDIAYELYV